MAAAEYYAGGSLHTPVASPYQHSQHPQSSYTNLSNNTPQGYHQHQNAPPPYQAVSSEPKPTVHFAQSPRPPPPPQQQQHRPSLSSAVPIPVPQQHRPSFSNQHPGSSQQNLQLYPNQPSSYHGTPPQPGFQVAAPHRQSYDRPYMHGNQSQLTVHHGYASDPEPHRRRRRRHEHRDDREPREESRKARSRSTNADGFLGAAGGGLIGDLIFPGLGTVGGALAGWLGGKDYGKYRKHREDRHDQEQVAWERKFRSRSNSHETRDDSRARRSYERHKSDF